MASLRFPFFCRQKRYVTLSGRIEVEKSQVLDKFLPAEKVRTSRRVFIYVSTGQKLILSR